MEEVVAKYPGSEGDLYTITSMACSNCIQDIDLFAQQNKKYTLKYVNNILTLCSNAQKMPNQVKRQSGEKTLSNAVTRANTSCCDNLQALKRYITTDGFKADDISAMLKAAGDDYYRSAARKSWQDTRTMNGMMTDFINEHPSELAMCGMPDTLIGKVTDDGAAFEEALNKFNENKSIGENTTADKITANNIVYDLVSTMMYDGKYIFKNKPAKLKLYSYADLQSKITHKPSGFKLWLTDAVTKKPVETAMIVIAEVDVEVEANKKGIMEVKLPIRKEAYNYTITAPGYEPVRGELLVTKNVIHRLKMKMEEAVSVQAVM